MNRVCAIVVAAGKGSRMGSGVKKQFLELKDKPILYYSLKAFEDNEFVDRIILVTSIEEVDYCNTEIVQRYHFKKVVDVVSGGAERQQSVYNGLLAAKGFNIVLIHDGARPFVQDFIIKNGIDYALRHGAAACGVAPKDTIKVKDEDSFSVSTLNRNTLFSVQTPQCFSYDLIFDCHNKVIQDNIKVTDDTSIVEYYGHKVFLYEGSYNNIKITTPEDLIIAEKILEAVVLL